MDKLGQANEMQKKQKFILAGIIILAIFFRFFLIDQMPGGLFPDEAANGLDINLMQQGHLQPFYERGNGREALFFYMLWGNVELFGKGPWQHHVVSALIGVLSVLICFLVTRRLFSLADASPSPVINEVSGLSPPAGEANSGNGQGSSFRATNIALLAAFLMATSTWHVVLSRTAFRAILIPLFASLTFYFLVCAYQATSRKRQLLFAFLTGASFALGFYTYIAFRIMVPILLVVLVWPLFGVLKQKQFGQRIKKYFWPAVFLAVAFAIFVFPIAKYFYQHSGSFVGRAGEVSVFNPNLYTYNGQQLQGKPSLTVVLSVTLEVAKEQLLGFFSHGDLNWRQNISGFPFLSALYSPFFGLGLIIVTWLAIRYFFAPAKKSRYWIYFLLAIWFWGMLLPVVTTAEGIPHGLRGIGVIPPVFIISSWALYEFAGIVIKLHRKLWQRARQHSQDPQWVQDSRFVPLRMRLVNFSFKLVVVGFVLALIFQAYFLYFVYTANSPANFYSFRSDLTVVSQYLVQRCQKDGTYLVLDKFSVQTTDYLTSDPRGNFQNPCNVPYHQVDPENSWRLSNLKPGDQIIFTQSTVFDTKKFKQYHSQASLLMEVRNKFNQTVMAVYQIK